MTKKSAAQKIYEKQKLMEAKPVAFATVYKRLVKLANGNWHFSGTGYDYTT